ncbi:MAG: thioredoxin domain-containing protein [Paludibacter sp.]
MKRTINLLMLCFIVSSMSIAQKSAKIEIHELDLKSFKQKVWDFDKNKTFKSVSKTPIILDFFATWCRPCKMLAPHLQTLQNKYQGKIIIYEIDVDKEPELAQHFNVSAMPTLIFIDSQTTYKTELGYQEYDALEKIMQKYFFAKKK